MEVICIEEQALFKLIQIVTEYVREGLEPNWQWVSTEKAMYLLGIKSKMTLQELRNNGEIRFSQPWKRVVGYDIESIRDFLERNAKDTF